MTVNRPLHLKRLTLAEILRVRQESLLTRALEMNVEHLLVRDS